MLRAGTTLVEAKSGYGLDLEAEVKQLKVRLAPALAVFLIPHVAYTGRAGAPRCLEDAPDFHVGDLPRGPLCAARLHGRRPHLRHRPQPVTRAASPSGGGSALVCLRSSACEVSCLFAFFCGSLTLLPDRAGELHVDNVDLFLEKGIIELPHARAILEAASAAGYQLNFHADEMHCMRGAELGAELGALSVSHLESVSPPPPFHSSRASTVAVVTRAYFVTSHASPGRRRQRASLRWGGLGLTRSCYQRAPTSSRRATCPTRTPAR